MTINVTPGGGINASTFSSGSFELTNTGTANITNVSINLSTAVLPDMVYDPNGTAGDQTAKGFSVDSEGGTGISGHALLDPHDGNSDDGYDKLLINFTDFQPGETLEFSIDVDPTSIKGVEAPGPHESGSVSGLELSGATVIARSGDGGTASNDLFSDGSVSGSNATATQNVSGAPAIDVENVSLNSTSLSNRHQAANVSGADQTVQVTGPANATVRLLHVEAGLFTEGVPDGGYDLEAFEANSVVEVAEYEVELDSAGTAAVDVTLTESLEQAGYNYFKAVVDNASVEAGQTSNVIVLHYQENAPPALEPIPSQTVIENQTLEVSVNASDPDDDTLNLSASSVPEFVTFTDHGNGSGTLTASPSRGDAGTYTIDITASDGSLTESDSFTLVVGLNGSVVYRVNNGGEEISSTGVNWTVDTADNPSPYGNTETAGNETDSTNDSVSLTGSVHDGVPSELFQADRYDPDIGTEMNWTFPVETGWVYEVRLYFAEIHFDSSNQRAFDVWVENKSVLDDYDIHADVGHDTGVMKSFVVVADSSNLDVDFTHVTDHPKISAIEIVKANPRQNQLSVVPDPMAYGQVGVNQSSIDQVTLTNLGNESKSGHPDITIDNTSYVGPNASLFSDDFSGNLTLAPGESASFNVTFKPTSKGDMTATLEINHSGENEPSNVSLTGNGTPVPVGFSASGLENVSLTNPTSVQWGPDDRLYVSQQNGYIHAYTVDRIGSDNYTAASMENITHINDIPNHFDNGSLSPAVDHRLVTGIYVTGNASHPVVYVTSSDPRIGGGDNSEDTNLDTNSGTLSRLSWNGTGWEHLVLVRGLPRSEENHAPNGLALSADNEMLFIAQGGHTNKGAPSNNFVYLPEYAYSAAILSVDLTQLENMTTKTDATVPYKYDLPTLQNTSEPWGGKDGENMAVWTNQSPVQVYAPGFRNSYDVLITEDGQMYTVDNGPNSGWGGTPVGEGTDGACTNEPNENNSDTDPDQLHLITGEGFYGGHPNPTRANESEYPGAVPTENPIECAYREPGPEDDELATFSTSTNGLTEYTATNFNGKMEGDLLAAGFDSGEVFRIQLNETGETATSVTNIFANFGNLPLDITTQSDNGTYPGTVWAVTYGSNDITVFEPNDFGDRAGLCSGEYDSSLDEDTDGYDNADEIDAGTDPCSSASVPSDFDGDFTSNVNDIDDDNDGLNDTEDPFVVDAENGLNTSLPVKLSFEPGSFDDSLLGLGFTGLMVNGSDYLQMYDTTEMTAGGAAGVLTVDDVPPGDPFETQNDQEYAFQFGVDPGTEPFTIHSTVLNPWPDGTTPENDQSAGIYIGPGDQDNYTKLVVNANDGNGGLQFAMEENGEFTELAELTEPGVVGDARTIHLFMEVDPVNDTVTASYSVNDGNRTVVWSTAIPASWTNTTDQGLAIGLISTSINSGTHETENPFTVSWGQLVAGDVNFPPTASFTVSPSKAGINQTVTFDASASSDTDGTVTDYEWDFDNDGNPDATGVNVTHNFTSAGDKDVTLRVTDDNGSVGRTTKTVTVVENFKPTPDFSFSPGLSRTNETVTFDASNSTDSDGIITTYEWDFDNDGTVDATGETATHNFSARGEKTVTLTVTDNDGGSSGTKQTLTVVDADNATPLHRVNAGGDAISLSGELNWDQDTGTNPSTHVNVEDAGNKVFSVSDPISLTSSVPNGTPAELFQTERWDPEAGAEMHWNFSVPSPDTYLIRLYFSEIYYSSPDERVFDVSIEGQTVLDDYDIYADVGHDTGVVKTFSVTADSQLNVNFSHLQENPKLSAIEILATPSGYPNATYTYSPSSPKVNDTVTFDASASIDPDENLTSYEWDFDGDGTGDATGVTVNHTFESEGEKTVTLAVTDENGSTATRTQTITVVESNAPNASFSYSPTNPDLGQTVTFDASNSTDPDGSITSYEWDFDDDGVTDATGVNVTHAYETLGQKNVTLTVTDDNNKSDGTSRAVTVGVEILYRVNSGGAAFAVSGGHDWDEDTEAEPSTYVNAQEAGNQAFSTSDSITLDASVPSTVPKAIFQSERWDPEFGTEMNWTFPVTAGETYTVRLYFAEINFEGTGERRFDVSLENQTVLDDYDIHADLGHDTGGVEIYTVTADDDSLDIAFEHVLENPKISAIEILETPEGAPDASFDYAPKDFKVNESVTFNASMSTDSDGNVTGYAWDFQGDGIIDASGENVTHSFDSDGDHAVTVFVTDDDNVTATSTQTVSVKPIEAPTAGFNHTPTTPDVNETVTFNASNSTDSDGNISSYEWDFNGDGTVDATGETVTHAFETMGDKNVTLTVTDEDGATDTASTVVTVVTTVVNRVNAGGATYEITGGHNWTEDTEASPSPYVNAKEAGNEVTFTNDSIALDESVPSHVPSALFQTERWDPGIGAELNWTFPVTAGEHYTIRIYFAEIHFESAGERVLDVSVDNQTVLDEYDIYADVGHDVGVVKTYTVVADDSTLDIDFGHVVENPKVSAIEVVETRAGAPNASFGYSRTEPVAGETVTFDASNSTDPDGNITGYEWDFDGDGIVDATGETVSHAFGSGGEKVVTLTVTDESGEVGTETETVSVLHVFNVDTKNATNVSDTMSTLNGELTGLGDASEVTIDFWYWEKGNKSETITGVAVGTFTEPSTFSANVTGLKSSTTYVFHARATQSDGDRDWGGNLEFETNATPLTVATQPASAVSDTSATLNGELTDLGGADSVNVSFSYWVEGDAANATQVDAGTLSAPSTFETSISGLEDNTTYVYQAGAETANDTDSGANETFETDLTPFNVDTHSATQIAGTSATLNGELSGLGGADSAELSFWYWQKGNKSETLTRLLVGTVSAPTPFNASISGLKGNTTYVFHARADTASDTDWGGNLELETDTVPLSVTTDSASDITDTSATLNGELIGLGGADSANVSFVYWKQGDASNATEVEAGSVTAPTTFDQSISGLESNTTYVYQAHAQTANDTDEGGNVTFDTTTSTSSDTQSLSVDTMIATDITNSTTTLNGELIALGGADSGDLTFWYWQKGEKSETITRVDVGTVSSPTLFNASISGLESSTTYVYHARVDTANDTDWGGNLEFETGSAPLNVTTDSATEITDTSATLNGELTGVGADGSANVSFSYWKQGDAANATEVDAGTLTSPSAFGATISGLESNTTYVFYAQAETANDTDQGGNLTFDTEPTPFNVDTNAATDITNTSATLNGELTGLGDASEVTIDFWYWEKGNKSETITGVAVGTFTEPSTFSANVTGLKSSTTYVFHARATQSDGDRDWGGNLEYTTE